MRPLPPLKMHGNVICTTQTINLLGIHLDATLTWRSHVDHTYSKICQSLYAINMLKNMLSRKILLTMYFGLIHSHLSYGILLWGNAQKLIIKKVGRIQEKAISAIFNKRHGSGLFATAGILKLADLFKLECIKFCYKAHNNLLLNLANMFLVISHTYNTRNWGQPTSNSYRYVILKNSF